MFHIENFLSKTKVIINETEDIQKEITILLEESIGLKISPQRISLVGSKIKLKISPLQKLHLLLNKQKFMEAISIHPTLAKKVTDIG